MDVQSITNFVNLMNLDLEMACNKLQHVMEELAMLRYLIEITDGTNRGLKRDNLLLG